MIIIGDVVGLSIQVCEEEVVIWNFIYGEVAVGNSGRRKAEVKG